jgi:hypothetical protein
MRRPDAHQMIRERAALSEQIVVVPHALARMRERDIDFLDVWRCLQRGKTRRGPYIPPDSVTDNVRYDVDAMVDGACLRVVVELPKERVDVVVFTVFVIE